MPAPATLNFHGFPLFTAPMRKVLFILGTRPEAIKLAPVIARMRDSGCLRAVLCATAQHRELLDRALAGFGLRPDIDLDLMRPGQTLPELTARLCESLPAVLHHEQPDAVVVQGDTTTVFAGSLCAFYQRIPVAHVEAGLRTGSLDAPFPEELNRRLTSVVARWHFAPTHRAESNLLREGTDPDRIHVTGNTVIDALQHMARRLPPLPAHLAAAPGERLVLVTGHRRESFGPGLTAICDALATLARNFPDLRIVYPVHPNPNVTGPVHDALGALPNVRLIEPVDYAVFVGLMRDAHLIVTDSGGVQEEAPALGKPVLVTRDTTERPEAIDAGCAQLVGTSSAGLIEAATRLLTDPDAYARMAHAENPFGDGRAAERIVAILERDLADSAPSS